MLYNNTYDLKFINETMYKSIMHKWEVPGFLNQHHVQKALGVPVNFSLLSQAVYGGFRATRDGDRTGFLESISYLLSRGIKVALVYGDRDYICNWIDGELVALKIKYEGWLNSDVGYEKLLVGEQELWKGMVRQAGNLSFTRVFQSGHEVPSYAPEAAFALFSRSMHSVSLSNGIADSHYVTHGPASTWHIKNKVREAPKPECYILDPSTFTEDVWEAVKGGNITVKEWRVVGDLEDKRDDEVGTGSGELKP
ncbi:MAG: hypothetical protein M1834_007797 [Cirrosporium novae-zelandiae]|nr:MAG: hypothetical protein M1834_007797 [Cirrosporium novae-zelandiae]